MLGLRCAAALLLYAIAVMGVAAKKRMHLLGLWVRHKILISHRVSSLSLVRCTLVWHWSGNNWMNWELKESIVMAQRVYKLPNASDNVSLTLVGLYHTH